MELLNESGDDHASGRPGDASLAVEDDWSGGSGVLQQGDDLVEAVGGRGRVLVQGNAEGFHFVVLKKVLFNNDKSKTFEISNTLFGISILDVTHI